MPGWAAILGGFMGMPDKSAFKFHVNTSEMILNSGTLLKNSLFVLFIFINGFAPWHNLV